MDRLNIITKEDNTQRVFLSENVLSVSEILENHYPYIVQSMKDEGFRLKYDECNLFKELVFEKKVVGFCSYDYSREFITAAINNIYVLPEFRGMKLFLEELERTMAEHNKPSIMEPTRLIVELLIEYGFARRINENIVASALEFVIPGEHVLSNSDYGNDELSTHFYDLNICASIHVLDFKRGCIAYSAPLNYDIVHYDCLESRAMINDEYFKKVTDLFTDNDVELMNVVLDLEDRLSIKKFTLDEVIGGDDGFSQYIESLIDDAHVTQSRAFEIKRQIREEYEAGMILNESLLIRLAYLFDENPVPSITSHEDICPYCSMPVDSHDRFCHFCGINLDYDPSEMEDRLMESISTHESDFREDLRFVAYKFLRLIENKIDLEYAIFTTESTYNVDWRDLKSFLSSNNYFDDGRITPEGLEFLGSHPLHYFEKYHMDIVNYTDFENYFYSHPNRDGKIICLDYLKQFGDDEFIAELICEIEKDCL